MRHDDQCSVISLESLLEDILRTDIHMVRRLVERQKIVRLEYELGHGKSCALTTAQYRNLLVDIFSLEKESAEDVSELQPYISDCNSVQCTENRILFIKYIFLILSIITYAYIVSDLRVSGHRIQLVHDHAHERCLSLTVSSDQSDLLTPAYFDLSIIKHDLGSISDSHVHSLVSDVSRTRSRRELHSQCGSVLDINLYPFKFFKLLDT